jgi:hypothetical protein
MQADQPNVRGTTDSFRHRPPYFGPVNLTPSNKCFLAERYLPALTPEALMSQVNHVRSAARAMSIRHIQTIYVPADETCFSLFEADSVEQVTETSNRFKLGYRRVVAAITLDGS